MSNTNARNVRDVADEQDLELGSDAVVGYDDDNNNTSQQQNSQSSTDDLPAEWRGKTPAELAQMLKDKEAMIGRQANELGHLRDLSNQLLQSQVSHSQHISDSQSSTDSMPEITSDDILENPTDAISRVVSPLIEGAVGELKEAIGSVNATSAAARFEKDHPEYEKDMQDPAFQEFVRSSKYRAGLANKALQNNDFEAADELWLGWEEYKAAQAENTSQQQHQEAQQNSNNSVQDAVTIRGGGNDGAHASHKPIYSAVKLQRMRNSDPDSYYNPDFQAKIIEAYQDGRVR